MHVHRRAGETQADGILWAVKQLVIELRVDRILHGAAGQGIRYHPADQQPRNAVVAVREGDIHDWILHQIRALPDNRQTHAGEPSCVPAIGVPCADCVRPGRLVGQ